MHETLHEFEKCRIALVPIESACLIILAISIIVAVLRAAQFVALMVPGPAQIERQISQLGGFREVSPVLQQLMTSMKREIGPILFDTDQFSGAGPALAFTRHQQEVPMANTSLEVKKSATPAAQYRVGDVWQSMRQEMEQLFDRFSNFDLAPFSRSIEHFWPQTNGDMLSVSVDMSEDDKAYTVTAELPGIDERGVNVEITNDVLTLKGEKRAEKEEKNKNRYVCERSYGAFQRSFALPADVDTNKIDAKFAKGVLTVVLPKNPKAQPAAKKIAVKAA